MRVQGWHLDQLPQLCQSEVGTRRVRLESIRHLALLSRHVAESPLRRLLPSTSSARTSRAFGRRLTALVDPVRAMELRPDRAAAFLDTVFYMVSHDAPSTTASSLPTPAKSPPGWPRRGSYEQLPLMSALSRVPLGLPRPRNAAPRERRRHADRDAQTCPRLQGRLCGAPPVPMRPSRALSDDVALVHIAVWCLRRTTGPLPSEPPDWWMP